MEAVMKQWKEEEAAEVEEESLVKRQAHHHMQVTNTNITTSKLEVQGMVSATEQTHGSSGLKQEQEIIQTESERVGVITENVLLSQSEGLFQKTPTQRCYCPNCLSPITNIVVQTQLGVDQKFESSTTREILKSTMYGGLDESIASLGTVTASASSDATTLNILVLSLANLIGRLFITVHNIWDLKSKQPRTNNVYSQVLGKREHFYLHVFIAILSFITFGLVPPLVYAFTFTESNNKDLTLAFTLTESNNKDLKLAAVAVASVICITLLSIAKAHIQRPNSYRTYLKTVIQYLGTSAMNSVVSYLAGQLVKELIEKLGWFDTKSSSFTLLLPEMSAEKPRFGPY